jgi:hypothetical protein
MTDTVGGSTVAGGLSARTDDARGSELHTQERVNQTPPKPRGAGKASSASAEGSKKGPLSDSDDELEAAPDDENYITHRAAGEGEVWAKKKAQDGPLQKSAPDLPADFMASIYATRTGRQHVDYLPAVPNLNEPSYVGTVKPRGMLEDWLDTGYDPWSEGKEPTASDRISSMDGEGGQADATGRAVGGAAAAKKANVVEFVDKDGKIKQKEIQQEGNREETLFEELKSYVRHGKYEELEDVITSPDYTMDIDHKDRSGNTLLLCAAQNGNKRIIKLMLRRGANINESNVGGNTALHYCYAYKFESLATYLMSKGADDSMVNAVGLTCYEGLDLESVEAL